MELQIENLKAQMRGETLNTYQCSLALDEYYKLIEYTEKLEMQVKKLNIDDVSKCLVKKSHHGGGQPIVPTK